MTNKEFAAQDQAFRSACEATPWKGSKDGNLPPTKRQASKWRSKRGLAYKTMVEGGI